MNPVDERFEHRLLDRFHYDDRQDGDGYGPDSPRVGDKGWIIWQTAFNELDRPFEIVRDEGRGRTGLPPAAGRHGGQLRRRLAYPRKR